MILYTQRDQIKSVYKRWLYQYPKEKPYVSKEHREIGDKLSRLNLTKVSADEVNKIIGNTSWTESTCGECGNHVPDVLIFNSDGDHSFCLCIECARKIASVIGTQTVV